MEPIYRYRAEVHRWVDGDTVDLIVDCGFDIWVRTRFRLYGVDTPERGQLNYKEAREFCETLAPVGSIVTIDTFKDGDKYGRWLANIYVDRIQVNEGLVASGLAKVYMLKSAHKV